MTHPVDWSRRDRMFMILEYGYSFETMVCMFNKKVSSIADPYENGFGSRVKNVTYSDKGFRLTKPNQPKLNVIVAGHRFDASIHKFKVEPLTATIVAWLGEEQSGTSFRLATSKGEP